MIRVTRDPLSGLILVYFTSLISLLMPSAYGVAETGKVLFAEHCTECHGSEGDGRGALGPYLEGQRPANLLSPTTQARSDQELFKIIKYGVHLEMPTWENILDDQEIRQIVMYIRDLASSLQSQ